MMNLENFSLSPYDPIGNSEAAKENIALKRATFAEIRKNPAHADFLKGIGPDRIDLLDPKTTDIQITEALRRPEDRARVAEQIHFFLVERLEAAYNLLAENEDGAYYIDDDGVKGFRAKGSLFGAGVTKAEDVVLLRNVQVGGGRNVSYEKIYDFLPPQVQEIFIGQTSTYFTLMTETQRARKLQEVSDKKAGGKVTEQEGFQWLSGVENFKPKSLTEIVSGRPTENQKAKPESETGPSVGYGILLREVISMYYHAFYGEKYYYKTATGVSEFKFTFGFLPSDKEYGSDPMKKLFIDVSKIINEILTANATAEWAQPFVRNDRQRETYLKSIVEAGHSIMWSWGEVIRLDPSSKRFALGGLVSSNRYFPREKDGGTSKSSNGSGTSKDFNPAVGDNPSLVELPTALIHKRVLLPLEDVQVGQTAADIQRFLDSFGPRNLPDSRLKNNRFMDAFAKISESDYFDGDSDQPDYEALSHRFIVVRIKASRAGSGGLPFLVERTSQVNEVLEELSSAVRSGDPARINISRRRHLVTTMNLRDALFVHKVPLVDRHSGLSLVNWEEGLQESNLQAQLALYYTQVENFFLKSSKTGKESGPFDFKEDPDWSIDPHFRVRWSTRLGFNLFSRLESYLGSGKVAQTVLNPMILSRKEQFADLFFEIYPKQDMDPLVAIVKRGGIRAELDRSGVQKVIDSIWTYYFRSVAQLQDFHILSPKYSTDGTLERIDHSSPKNPSKPEEDAEVFPEAFAKMFREPEHWRVQPVFASERVSVAYTQQARAVEVLTDETATPPQKKEARLNLAKAVFSLKTDLVLRPLFNLYFGKLMFEYSQEERSDLFPDVGTVVKPELEDEYVLRWLMTDNPFPTVTGGKERAPLPHKLAQMVLHFTELYTEIAQILYEDIKKIDPAYVDRLPDGPSVATSTPLVRRLLGRLAPYHPPELTPSQKTRYKLNALLADLLPGLRTQNDVPNTHQLTIGNFRYLMWHRLSELGVISGPRWHVFAMEMLQLAGLGKYNKRIDGEKEYLNLQQLKNEGITLVGNPEK